jgi:hypothetical protein
MSIIWEIQKALYEKLSADATLMGIISGVYDHVPERSEFPYITIGDIAASDNSRLGMQGHVVSANLNVYSRGKGRKEVLAVMDRVKLLVADGLAADGYLLPQVKLIAEESGLLGDGVTYKAVLGYRLAAYAI